LAERRFADRVFLNRHATSPHHNKFELGKYYGDRKDPGS